MFLIDDHYETIYRPVRTECHSCRVIREGGGNNERLHAGYAHVLAQCNISSVEI